MPKEKTASRPLDETMLKGIVGGSGSAGGGNSGGGKGQEPDLEWYNNPNSNNTSGG